MSALPESSFPSAPQRFRFRALKGWGWQRPRPGAEPGETRETLRPQNRLCCDGEALPGARWCLVVEGGSGSCPARPGFRLLGASPRRSRPARAALRSWGPQEFLVSTRVICPAGPPGAVGSCPWGAPSLPFPSGFAFLRAQNSAGTIKPSLFPLRVRLSVPTLRGSGLILPKTPQKAFSVDAVAGPSVPLDVRPGGGRYLDQGVSFASGFAGFPPSLILFWSLSRMDLEAGMQEIQCCCCGVFF